MSFFGMGSSAPKASSTEKIQMWESEILAVSDLQERLNRICKSKCISDFFEPTLAKGQAVCLDRCTAKFFEAQKLVTDGMRNMQQQNLTQAQSADSGDGGSSLL